MSKRPLISILVDLYAIFILILGGFSLIFHIQDSYDGKVFFWTKFFLMDYGMAHISIPYQQICPSFVLIFSGVLLVVGWGLFKRYQKSFVWAFGIYLLIIIFGFFMVLFFFLFGGAIFFRISFWEGFGSTYGLMITGVILTSSLGLILFSFPDVQQEFGLEMTFIEMLQKFIRC